jgi:biofilm PGA synthesis N-glycosyltransferase PgaC
MTQSRLVYALITPARNEEAYLDLTINSIVQQSVRPVKWIIVSDGSTDGTDEVIRKHAAKHMWIELVRMTERKERHFAGKVDCFNAGYEKIKGLKFDIIGNVDADTIFDKDYFSFLLDKFAEHPGLGVGGTAFTGEGGGYDYKFSNIEHVSGPCQLFRRQCFEAIGGYARVKGGGIDVIAVLTARMKGWETKTFAEKTYVLQREMGKGKHGGLMARFKYGEKDYLLGGHPVWEIFRSVYQMRGRPLIIGGCLLLAGYAWAMLRQVERPVSRELIAFRRHEQLERLRKFMSRMNPFNNHGLAGRVFGDEK